MASIVAMYSAYPVKKTGKKPSPDNRYPRLSETNMTLKAGMCIMMLPGE
jgi:hypothetical protein